MIDYGYPVKAFKSVPGGKTAEQKAHDFGMWCLAHFFGENGRADKARQYCKAMDLPVYDIKNMGNFLNTAGGALVPDEFIPDIISLKETYGVFARLARRAVLTSESATRAVRKSGLVAYFPGEAGSITASDMVFGNVSLLAKKMAALCIVNNELNTDSAIEIGNLVADEISQACAEKEDQCGFNGDGTSTYAGFVGIRNALLNLSATRANIAGLVVGAGNAYSELTLANFRAVAGKLPAYASKGRGAAWFCHQDFYYNTMAGVAAAAGNAIAAEFNNTIGTASPRFLGFPVEMTQVMPKVEANDQVCCLLGNLDLASVYATVKNELAISTTESLKFTTDQLAIRGVQRVDIANHGVGNATSVAADQVPGAVVGLLTAAS